MSEKITDKLKDKLPMRSAEPEHKTEKEKLEERREEILAKGRKFKYPMQFAKHRLVFVTIIVAVVALIAAGGITFVSLYKTQSTSDIIYRLTSVLSLPVAKIDGERVRYSDYLMIYRSSITPVEQQNGTGSTEASDLDNLRSFYQRTALTEAENYTYALKLASQFDIKVTDAMVDEAFEEHRKVGGSDRSEESFLKVLEDNFGLTKREYRRMLLLSLTKMEVSKKIDTAAADAAKKAAEKVQENGGDLRKAAEELNLEYEETGGLIDVMNVDGGRSSRAYAMNPGEVSQAFVSQNGDGYYILKCLDKADARVSYASIKVPFTEFTNRLANVREENRVEEYITIPGYEDPNQSN